jgi:hypothetical protein
MAKDKITRRELNEAIEVANYWRGQYKALELTVLEYLEASAQVGRLKKILRKQTKMREDE